MSEVSRFMFPSQSMIVTPSTNTNSTKVMTCSLYPGGAFYGTNIIMYKVLFWFYFMQSPQYCNYNYFFYNKTL